MGRTERGTYGQYMLSFINIWLMEINKNNFQLREINIRFFSKNYNRYEKWICIILVKTISNNKK